MNNPFQSSRLIARIWLLWHAIFHYKFPIASSTEHPKKILIPTQLLLGDCVLIVSLVEKVRLAYPQCEVVVALPAYAEAIYQSLDLGVTLFVWREKDLASLRRLKTYGPYEIAFVPYEKWGAIWAKAFGAREVIGFSFPLAGLHYRFLTKTLPLPDTMLPISDWVMELVPNHSSVSYKASERFKRFDNHHSGKRIMLHIGARNPNRRWLAGHWQELADLIRDKGWHVLWSYAPNEKVWADQIIKNPQDEDIGGKLSFDSLLQTIANVDAVVCPDTGIVHLCKLTATPNVVIYGQGNPAIHGNGVYWQHSPVRNLFIEDIPCRDMRSIFGRELEMLRRCDRGPEKCANPYCQNTITAQAVMIQLVDLLQEIALPVT